MPGLPTHNADQRQKASQRFKKSPNHFRVPCSSNQTSSVLCSELTEFLSAQWQAIPLSPVYQSVSLPAPLRPHFLPDSSLSTLWYYLLLQLAIIPSALQHIVSLFHNLLNTPHTSLSWSLSLSCCMWIDELLLCWMSGCLTEDTPAAGGTPGDKCWLHVPTTSAWWSAAVSVRVGFSLCVCLMRGDHWSSPVTFTLQQWSRAGKGHRRVSASSVHTGQILCLCVATTAIHGSTQWNRRSSNHLTSRHKISLHSQGVSTCVCAFAHICASDHMSTKRSIYSSYSSCRETDFLFVSFLLSFSLPPSISTTAK